MEKNPTSYLKRPRLNYHKLSIPLTESALRYVASEIAYFTVENESAIMTAVVFFVWGEGSWPGLVDLPLWRYRFALLRSIVILIESMSCSLYIGQWLFEYFCWFFSACTFCIPLSIALKITTIAKVDFMSSFAYSHQNFTDHSDMIRVVGEPSDTHVKSSRKLLSLRV